jgi:acetylornithine deacetylase/succinyl-diaminopimelate desuccinylase-like protein
MSRVGPGQDPEKLNSLIIEHITNNSPWSVKVTTTAATYGKAPYFDENNLGFKIAYEVLTREFGQAPAVLYVGGGVPALAYVSEVGGPELVSFGFQRSDEGFHADNEFMRIRSFTRAQSAYINLLHALVGQQQN